MRVNGINYHVILHQERSGLPALILLHGFMGSGRVFDHLIQNLKAFCNPVTIDLLGHANTEGADTAKRYETDKQVTDLHQIFTTLPFQQRYLYGYSMGGRLALQFVCRHQNLLHGVILESTTCGFASEHQRNRRKKKDEKRGEMIIQNFENFIEQWKSLPLFSTGADKSAPLLNRYNQIQRSQNATQMARSLRGFGTGSMPSCRRHLPQMHLPIQLVAGEYDTKFCTVNREMHRLLPNSDLSIVSGAGHRVHLDRPDIIIELLNKYIEPQKNI